jgi:hypothetical protein
MRVTWRNGFLVLGAVVGSAGMAVPCVVAQSAPIMLVDNAPQKEVSPQSFALEVLYKQQKMWAGTLRVSRGAGANYNQQMSQSVEPCPSNQEPVRSFGNVSESLRVSLNSVSPTERGAVRVSVQLERPKMVCGAMGSDTISIQRAINLESGKSIAIEGEGGLTVRVTRT